MRLKRNHTKCGVSVLSIESGCVKSTKKKLSIKPQKGLNFLSLG